MLRVWLPFEKDERNVGLDSVNMSVNGGTFGDDGKDGKCYTTGSNGSGVFLNNYMSILKTFSSYTMCAWIYMTSTAAGHSSTIISSGNWNTKNGNMCFGLYNYNSNGYQYLLIPNKGTWRTSITLSNRLGLNTWYHVAVTYDGVKTRAYVNGTLVGESANGGICDNSETANIKIGSATYHDGFTLKGKIDDVRIYDNALLANEIAELYGRTRSQGLQIWFPPVGYKNIGLNAINEARQTSVTDNGSNLGFNGSSSYLSLESGVSLTTKGFSYAALAFFANTAVTHCLYSQRSVVGGGYAIFLINGRFRFDCGDAQWSPTQAMPANKWVHVAFTYDGKKKKFYYNGSMMQEVGATTTSNIAHMATIGGSEVADDGIATSNYLNGKLSDVKVYDIGLMPKDVDRLWKSAAVSVLYKELEYIEGTGSSYLNTGTQFNPEVDYCKVVFKGNDTANNGMVFATQGTKYFWLYYYGSSGIRVYADNGSGQQGIAGIPSDLNKHTMEWKNKHYIIDGVDKGTFSNSYTNTSNNVWLFSYGGSGYPFKGRMYYAEIVRSGKKVREFVPAKRLSDSAVGMYDKVNGTFYPSASSTAFVAGPEI